MPSVYIFLQLILECPLGGSYLAQGHNPWSDGLTLPLEDRVALVTGASSGIGEATALRLAENGAHVVVGARRVGRLHSLVGRARLSAMDAVELDVTSEASTRSVADFVERQHGRLDILVNNAGVMFLARAAEASVNEWRAMIEVNLLGLMKMTRAMLPFLARSQAGHVVNIASLAGRVANPSASGYAATKFGVVGFSESLRRELVDKRIRVTVIEPGAAATELPDHTTNERARTAQREHRGQFELLEADDVAAAVLYAVLQPPRVSVNELVIRPTGQER
jgi:NADP-dependent 3-hydroxy acid dehydrogenase YdfG